MLALKIYMSPKMPLIASEPSIERQIEVFLLMQRSPRGLGGPGSVATRLLWHPRAHRLVVFDSVYWQWQ